MINLAALGSEAAISLLSAGPRRGDVSGVVSRSLEYAMAYDDDLSIRKFLNDTVRPMEDFGFIVCII